MGVTTALAFHPVINSGFLVPLTAEKNSIPALHTVSQPPASFQSPESSLLFKYGPPTPSSVLSHIQLTGSTSSTKPLGNLHGEMIEAALLVNQEVVMDGLPVSAGRSLG